MWMESMKTFDKYLGSRFMKIMGIIWDHFKNRFFDKRI